MYKAGDSVLLASRHFNLNLQGNTKRKLASVYLGPFDVLKASDNTVTLNLPHQLAICGIHPTINVAFVRPYYARPDWQPTEPVEPLIVNGERQDLVDHLIARRTRLDGTKPEYLV